MIYFFLMFELLSDYKITPAQAKTVKEIVNKFSQDIERQVLLGVTGSGKTFVVANIIKELNLPTLVFCPNKSLAAQLYQEFRQFFPKNKVGYFISYYDYYQPEAYVPQRNSYISKEVQINQEIEQLRTKAVHNLLGSRYTIIVASVSAIYSFGSPADFKERSDLVYINQSITRDQLIDNLISLGYQIIEDFITKGKFRIRGNIIEVFGVDQENPVRFIINTNYIENIEIFDSITGQNIHEIKKMEIFPTSNQYQRPDLIKRIIPQIKRELKKRIEYFNNKGELEFAQRIKKRTLYDLEMLQELGFVSGIENYSMYLSGRDFGNIPYTLIDYFEGDFLTVIDESHITIPQLNAMYNGDRSRKQNLINYGFRLPSALENRPLKFTEFNQKIEKTLFVSATPAEYEIKAANHQVSELLVRPTGLLDPLIDVRRSTSPIEDLRPEIEKEIKKNNRILITTLTKRMAEKLSEYLSLEGFKAAYMHSEIKTLERIKVINRLREGKIDILIGINLLREGLDLPEVSLVIILDADSEGYLRSRTAIIQILGRASRNISGRAILYITKETGSLKKAIHESGRRRQYQTKYNQKHNITPTQVKRKIDGFYDDTYQDKIDKEKFLKEFKSKKSLQEAIQNLTEQMKEYAARLEFKEAIGIRDRIKDLKNLLINEFWEE